MTQHNKLVRDKIPEILDVKGVSHAEHIAGTEEYEQKLFEKLLEESRELSFDKSQEELVDLLEVIEAIKILKGWDTMDIEKLRLLWSLVQA